MKISEIKEGAAYAIGAQSDIENRTARKALVENVGLWDRNWNFAYHGTNKVWFSPLAPKSNIGIRLFDSSGTPYFSVVKAAQVLCRWEEYERLGPSKASEDKAEFIKELGRRRAVFHNFRQRLASRGIEATIHTPYEGLPLGLILDEAALRQLFEVMR